MTVSEVLLMPETQDHVGLPKTRRLLPQSTITPARALPVFLHFQNSMRFDLAVGTNWNNSRRLGSVVDWLDLRGIFSDTQYAIPEESPRLMAICCMLDNEDRFSDHFVVGRLTRVNALIERTGPDRVRQISYMHSPAWTVDLAGWRDRRHVAGSLAFRLPGIEPFIAEVLRSTEEEAIGPIAVMADFVEETYSLALAQKLREMLQ